MNDPFAFGVSVPLVGPVTGSVTVKRSSGLSASVSLPTMTAWSADPQFRFAGVLYLLFCAIGGSLIAVIDALVRGVAQSAGELRLDDIGEADAVRQLLRVDQRRDVAVRRGDDLDERAPRAERSAGRAVDTSARRCPRPAPPSRALRDATVRPRPEQPGVPITHAGSCRGGANPSAANFGRSISPPPN